MTYLPKKTQEEIRLARQAKEKESFWRTIKKLAVFLLWHGLTNRR